MTGIGGDEWLLLTLAGPNGLADPDRLVALSRDVTANTRRGTILDLTGLSLLDAPVLGWMLRLKVKHDGAGRLLRLTGVSAQHRSVLGLRGLSDTFSIYPDVESAKSSP